MVHFPIVLDFLFITFSLHFFLSWIMMSIIINKQNNDKFKFEKNVFSSIGNYTTFISANKGTVL